MNGKTALITGGAVRLGAAIARALAERGCRLVLHYGHSAGPAEELRAECEALGARAWTLQADLDDPAACGALVETAAGLAGPIDILVNNAAVFHKDTFETLDPEKLRREFQVNLFAPLLLTRAFAAQNRPGRIVNLLDRRITGLDTACVPYVLSKKALAEATRLAALAYAPRIAVNAVAPGPALPPPGEGPDYLRDRAGAIPLERICTPEDVAAAVCYLLETDTVTGQVIFVDGGQHLLSHP